MIARLGLLVAALTGAFAQPAQAQSKTVLLTGRVSEIVFPDSSERSFGEAVVEIWSRDEMLKRISTNSKGMYNCRLEYFNYYTVKYFADSMVTKMVEIDATDFAQETRERGFTMVVDMTLFRQKTSCPGFGFLGEEPVGKARYNKRARSVVWDFEHTAAINDRIRDTLASCTK
jgi:hypothetical protein